MPRINGYISGKLFRITRLGNSDNGNPKYKLGIQGMLYSTLYRTAEDIMDSYKITEHWLGKEVEARLDKKGKIISINLL